MGYYWYSAETYRTDVWGSKVTMNIRGQAGFVIVRGENEWK